MKYKDLCNKAIGDMNKEELFEFANGLLEEVYNYEDKIDKAIEYIEQLPYNDLTPLELKVILKIFRR